MVCEQLTGRRDDQAILEMLASRFGRPVAAETRGAASRGSSKYSASSSVTCNIDEAHFDGERSSADELVATRWLASRSDR